MPPADAYPRPHACPDYSPARAHALAGCLRGRPRPARLRRTRHAAHRQRPALEPGTSTPAAPGTCLTHWEDHNFGWRAILDSPSGRFLGLAALNYLGDLVPGIEESAIEIGWWLDPGAWGCGIATEAATAIRDEAFSRLHTARIAARLQPRNHASGRVAARLGMRLHGKAAGRTGEPVLVYLIHRPDWQASLAAPAVTSQNSHGRPHLPPAGRNE